MDVQVNPAAVPAEDLPETPQLAAQPASPLSNVVPADDLPTDYGSAGQSIAAGAEAAGRGALGPVAPFLERVAGVPKADIEGRREAFEQNHPVASTLSEIGGLGASALTGVGEAKALDLMGEGAAHLVGLGSDGALARIGSAAVKGAAENALYSAGDSAAKAVSGDPNLTVQNALTSAGLSAVIGGGVGGSLGSVGELWNATKGSKLGTLLKGIADRTGGIEGAEVPATEQTFKDAGIELSPAVAGLASDNPLLRQEASTLSQGESHFARTADTQIEHAYEQAADGVAASFGRKADEVGDFDKYDHGNRIANAVQEDFSPQLEGPVKSYEKYRENYSNVDLPRSMDAKSEDLSKAALKLQSEMNKTAKALDAAMEANDSEKSVELASKMSDHQSELAQLNKLSKQPGASDTIQEKLAKLVQDESWNQTPDSGIMSAYKRLSKNSESLETLGGLRKQAQDLGSQARAAFRSGDSELGTALRKMKSVLDDVHEKSLFWAVGKKEGIPALAELQVANKGYRAAAMMRDELNGSLHADSHSVSGFGKSVKEMGRTDGEAVFNRLNGKNDANILNVLQKQYPKTAQAVRDAHLDQLFKASTKDGKLQAPKFFQELNKLTKSNPTLKEFLLQGADGKKLAAIEQATKMMVDKTKNHSMSGVVGSRLMSGAMGNAIGMITAISSHLPGIGFVVGKAADLVGREAGDAARYGMLKFLGSNKPINSAGFKATVDLYHHSINGDKLANKAVKSIFNSGVKVLPDHAFPTENDRNKLDKQMKKVQADPSVLTTVGQHTAHYLPNEGTAMAQAATQAANYINSKRPQPSKASPLDSDAVVSPDHKAAFNNVLNIAHQPLIIMDKINNGTLTPQDIQHLQGMYPQLAQQLQSKVTQEMVDHISKGGTIPYKTRLGVSLFTGKALDSTMSPLGISSAQPKTDTAGSAAPPPKPGQSVSSKGASALQKSPKQFRTVSQSAEQDRSDRS